jgi:hypothetical protein
MTKEPQEAESDTTLLRHHYNHADRVHGCQLCKLEKAFETAGINERNVRDLLGVLDDIGYICGPKPVK